MSEAPFDFDAIFDDDYLYFYEPMLADVVAMAHAGRLTRRGLPRSLFDLAALARRYEQEAHAPLLGIGAQRLLLAPLLLPGRLAGTRPASRLVPQA